MYLGQLSANPWQKNTWATSLIQKQSRTAASAALGQTPSQPKVPNRDRLELSGSYPCLPNRLQVLETPDATQAESNLDPAAELRPASEKEEYTAGDALLKQYMKQYRLDFIQEGDTWVLDTSKPVKLMLESQVSQESLDEFRAQLEANGLGDAIDWRGVQEDFLHMDLRFDNADHFATKVDYLASRYAILKDRIQTQYPGDQMAQELQTLDTLYTKAKEELATSYADHIGGFYEDLGQTGAAQEMRESVLETIDRKADAYTAYLAQNDLYGEITDPSQQWLKQDDGYMAARLREQAAGSPADAPAQAAGSQPPYDAEDLAFAASCAKDLSQQLKHPAWDTYDTKANDADLGKALAQQYHALANGLEDAGISKGMSTLLKDAFVPFLDHYLDALDEKIDQNRARVASKPWQAGLIRTEYIHREEVYRAFALFF